MRLIRIRRLAGLGLGLADIGTALADDDGRELRDILARLHADLGAQEQRLRADRDSLGLLLARDGDLALSPEVAEALRALAEVAGPAHPALERERQVLQLMEPLAGDGASDVWGAYRTVLADPALRAAMLDLARRFEQLATVPADDPAVQALADDTRLIGSAMRALVPDDAPVDPDGVQAAELLRGAMSADLSPAQARCLELAFEHWRAALA